MALLNIRNREDENCFLYYFTAANHFKYGPRLVPAGASSRRINSPATYGPTNPIAKQANGVFSMPMGFHQMTKFEDLNDVRVNVFRYADSGLTPFRVSKKLNCDFNLDLLLLSDGQMHHYVLIRNLRSLVHRVRERVEHFHFECVSGLNVMSQFVASLEQLARKIYSVKQRNRYFSAEAPIAREDVTECWICEETLENTVENPTVLHHCHFTGQFLGWAHNNCNINRKFLNYTPLFAHNLSNYDLHHVILALQGSNMRNTISIIPSTDEKFIALEIGVLIKMRPNKNGVDKPVYEHIRLLDSFRFMPSSLDALAKNLPANEFIHLEKYFSDWPKSSVEKLKQKRNFPYNYIESFSKLGEARLPPREKWTNSLQQYDVSVTEDDYKHALTVFETFKCKTIGEYYNLYLKTAVFLLASVVLFFRKVCYQTYGLDCCQYYTASNLSGDAMLKICKAPLELLTEREQLDMVEELIRGGVSSIYNKRLAVANNKYLPNFDPKQPSTFIVMIDANNLSNDFYADLQKKPAIKDLFDFSNLPAEHELYDGSNAQVTLKFKDERGGKLISEFVGLKTKLYSIKLSDGFSKQSAKGVTRDARRNMTHELYKQVPTGGETVRLVNTRIASSKHQLMTVVCNKKSLSGYDDKRYIMHDKVTTLPYGHHALREEMFMRNMMCDPDWDSSDEEETNVHFAESTMEQSPPVTPHTQLQ
ncbi:uncharacterized protein LOC142346188 [Convolutriloba macropyga]|uniref:uncharacterized protein LOC142346188 n=1 Tax=Convolutriloba macropyga TaxID=536237 RepID=UPI003F526E1F